MSSQGSLVSTPVDSPLLAATSPLASKELPGSMLAVGSLYPATEYTSKNSPPSSPSSMTPPPSSQAPNSRRRAASIIRRTPTPTSLSSPPLTTLNGVKRESSNGTTLAFSVEQVSEAVADELREMLEAALAENRRLETVVAEERMNTAHYKLQHNLLALETEDAVKRLEVEHDMTRREVEVLQHACQGRETPAQDYVAKLKAYCYSIEEDNAALEHRLDKAKKVIENKDEELAAAKDRLNLMTDRVKQNREHLNYLRSPGGIFHTATPSTSHSYPATPQQQYRSTPKHTPMTGRSAREARAGEDSFAALLMADRVLSQENNSAPSTPLVGRPNPPRTPVRHQRGVQSLSSLPTTPRTNTRIVAPGSALLPSVQFTPRDVYENSGQLRERRRKSRDSTISVEDAEEMARQAMRYARDVSEEVYESHASQTASEMLRVDPRESYEVAASRTQTPVHGESHNVLHQARIYGPVTKTVVEKRKRGDDDGEYTTKKLRVGTDGVGLGIGYESRI